MTTSATQAIGRESERATIRRFLVDDHQGAAALILHGDPGIGKTTLWRDAVALAQALGSLVLWCRPAEAEATLPYAALGDLLAPVLDDILPRLPEPQRRALEVALLRETAEQSPIEQGAVAAATLGALRMFAVDNALLVAVDDVQWLDPATESALTFAVRRLEASQIRLVVALRTDGRGDPMPPLGLGAWRSGVEHVEVGALSATDLGAVLAHHMVAPPPRPRVELITQRSAGNPMFALELARRGTDRESVPRTLHQAVLERLRDLAPEAREAINVAATMLEPREDRLLDAGVGRSGLAAAVSADVLMLDAGVVRFSHPLLASIAYDTLGADERRQIHLRLADRTDDVLEQGHHLARSTDAPNASVADRLDDAARAASRLGDHTSAAGFLLRAAELAPDLEGRVQERRVGAAVQLELAGDVASAQALSSELVGSLAGGVLRARAREILVSSSVGDSLSYEEGLRELAGALDDAVGDDRLQAELHITMGDILSGMCRLQESSGHLQSAIELAERAGAEDLRRAALAESGFALSMLGHGISENATEALRGWDGKIVSTNGYSPRMAFACELTHATRFHEAEGLFRQEISAAEEQGLEPIEVTARLHLAEAQIRAGDWAEALVNGRLAVEHAKQAANAQIGESAMYGLAMASALVGNHEVARSLAAEGLAVAEAIEDFWYTMCHRAVLGLVAFAEDELEPAVDALTPAWQLMRDRDLGNLSIFPIAQVLVEALIALDRTQQAEAIVAELVTCPVGDLPWCRAMAARCRALLASAEGRHEIARQEMQAAIDAHRSLPEPFELGRTRFIEGRIERRAHGWARARTAFTEAMEIFDQLGATHWAEKSAAELARIPGRRAAPEDGLTATEQAVAELVAQGLSNKEVAAKLFVIGARRRIEPHEGVREARSPFADGTRGPLALALDRNRVGSHTFVPARARLASTP